MGKGTIVEFIKNNYPNVHVSVSATTRAPRPGEIDGQSYYFVTKDEFSKMVSAHQLLEYAEVHGGNLYGTPRLPVEEALAKGKPVILEIDIQGARQIKNNLPDARTIFIAPPSWEDLAIRLAARGTETDQERKTRLETAKLELAAQDECDFVVINDEIPRCAAEVVDLLQS